METILDMFFIKKTHQPAAPIVSALDRACFASCSNSLWASLWLKRKHGELDNFLREINTS